MIDNKFKTRKDILIVNNNLLIGGIQKALVGLLNQIHEEYQVTLLLFKKTGALIDKIPKSIKIIETNSDYKYLGQSQKSWNGFERLKRGFFVILTRIFGFKFVVPLLNATVKKKELLDEFDVAISYMHNSSSRNFYGGAADYVLSKVKAKKKICFIHCDYLQSGTANDYNNKIYSRFDKIVCVSDSVKQNFDKVLPCMSEKSVGLPNAININEINELAQDQPFQYDKNFINFVSVARLSPEKGLERAICAFSQIERTDFRYYIIGGGPQLTELQELIRNEGLENQVLLMGEQANPYRYMVGADWLVVPSYHEAAPVVFQEAKALHLPILTTDTSSAKEMVGAQFGIVVDNSTEGLLKGIKESFIELDKFKDLLSKYEYDEREVLEGFKRIVE